jgi:pimeloyl-ACP methyl ester carboxylesterase
MPITSTAAGPVHWVRAGSGAPLVLLHGLGGDVTFWEAELEALSGDYLTVAIDLRGAGSTPPTPGGHSMDDLADDIAAVLDDLEVERAHVLGFSMGGCAAQAFAIRHPGRVDRLMLASTFATMNVQARMFLDAVASTYARSSSAKEMFDLICPWLFSTPFLADPANKASVIYGDETIDAGEMRAWSSAYAAQREFDSTAMLGAILAPTLVIAGRHDRLTSLDDAIDLGERISNAELVIIEDAGHLTNVEQPLQFLDAVRNHLSPAA